MFFILVLLVIAFGTVFRIQQYRYNALLRRLILMAVLINFSKTITGLFIDLTQVVMLTFVNAYADTAAGNFATLLGLRDALSLSNAEGAAASEQVSTLSVMATLLLAVIMYVISFVVIVIFLIIFLIRIIALWVLTILSPTAYLLSTFPSTRSYSSQWWRMFWQYATVGPVLAFFLWLSLTISQAGTVSKLITDGIPESKVSSTTNFGGGGGISTAISAIGSESGVLGFMVGIILLVAALVIASKAGVAGGQIAGQAAARIQREGSKAAQLPFRLAGRAAAGAGRGVYENTIARQVEKRVPQLMGALGSVPIIGTAAMKAQARMEKAKKARDERSSAWVDDVTDVRSLARIANQRASSPTAEAAKKRAQNRAPAEIQDHAEFEAQLQSMEQDKFSGMSSAQIIDITKRLEDNGQSLINVAPDKAKWLVRSAPNQKRRAAGLAGVRFNENTQEFTDTTGVKVPNTFVPTPDLTAVPTRDPAHSRFNQNQYLADISDAKMQATRDAVEKRFGGSADAFFQSSEFKLNPQAFLPKDAYQQTMAQQENQRRVNRGEQRLADVTGVKTAIQKGGRGEAANLAIDFNDAQALGLTLAQGAAGAHLSADQQKIAAQSLSGKYREQEEAKEITQRRQELQTDADTTYQQERERAAARGEIGTVQRREVTDEDARRDVQANTALQTQLTQRAGEFRGAMENASSLNLVNKARAGRSARQVLRHEQSHEAVDEMDPKQLNDLWSELSQERQQEVEQYIRANWVNGQSMKFPDIQREFFTEAMASHGRGEHIGPLQLTDQEDNVAAKLGDTVGLRREERARFEVDKLPKAGLDSVWEQLPGERQQEISSHVRGKWAQGEKLSDDDVKREFFSEALAAHRTGTPNTQYDETGDESQSPMNFKKEEQDLALLLHAGAAGKIPHYASRAPVSAAELRPQAQPVLVTTRPAGERTVTAQPPTRIVERAFDSKPSPLIQTNVVQNTTVRSIAEDFSRKLSGRVENLPSRQDMVYFLRQMENTIGDVARVQGISQRDIEGLKTEIDQLKSDTQSPGEGRTDQEVLQTNFRKFLNKFLPTRERGGEEYPSARGRNEPPSSPPQSPPST